MKIVKPGSEKLYNAASRRDSELNSSSEDIEQYLNNKYTNMMVKTIIKNSEIMEQSQRARKPMFNKKANQNAFSKSMYNKKLKEVSTTKNSGISANFKISPRLFSVPHVSRFGNQM